MKRAVIYCRTSTTEEFQLNALDNQVQEASACVKTQGWQLVDSYVESGSGTTTHGRDQYKRLLNPHRYKVDLSDELWMLKQSLLKHRDGQEIPT